MNELPEGYVAGEPVYRTVGVEGFAPLKGSFTYWSLTATTPGHGIIMVHGGTGQEVRDLVDKLCYEDSNPAPNVA